MLIPLMPRVLVMVPVTNQDESNLLAAYIENFAEACDYSAGKVDPVLLVVANRESFAREAAFQVMTHGDRLGDFAVIWFNDGQVALDHRNMIAYGQQFYVYRGDPCLPEVALCSMAAFDKSEPVYWIWDGLTPSNVRRFAAARFLGGTGEFINFRRAAQLGIVRITYSLPKPGYVQGYYPLYGDCRPVDFPIDEIHAPSLVAIHQDPCTTVKIENIAGRTTREESWFRGG